MLSLLLSPNTSCPKTCFIKRYCRVNQLQSKLPTGTRDHASHSPVAPFVASPPAEEVRPPCCHPCFADVSAQKSDVQALKTLRDQRKVPFWRLAHGCRLHKRKIRPRGECWGSDAWCHADTHKTYFPSEGLLEGSLPKRLAAEGHWRCFVSPRLSVLVVAGGLSPLPAALVRQSPPSSSSPASLPWWAGGKSLG